MDNNLKKAAVIGDPIKHSRSPLLHGWWLKKYGIEGRYDLIRIEAENLEERLRALEKDGFLGVNVTIPHKETVFKLCQKRGQLSKSAMAIGAVNMLTFTQNKGFYGDNTDAYGFIQNLKKSAPNWKAQNCHALILGAGGAARAVIYALKKEGVTEITISNRTHKKAQNLAKEFSCQTQKWQDKEALLPKMNMLINTTSLGMEGQPPLDISLETLPENAVIYDLVYTALKTPLLKQAENLKLHPIDGLGMLLWQAVPAFEKWFGQKPEITDSLRKAVLFPKKPFLLGLTGSIGMGKTTAAMMLAEMGCPMQNADKIVHDIYEGKIAGAAQILTAFPAAKGKETNIIDRQKLSHIIQENPQSLKILESLIHPLVSKERQKFIQKNQNAAMPLIFDIPLLYESGLEAEMDGVLLVTAPLEVQKSRVLARPNMSLNKFETLLKRQMPDAEKRAHADYIIFTDKGKKALHHALKKLLDEIIGSA